MSETMKIQKVFTPTSQARANYVDRVALNNRVYDALTTPGMQVVIYGESGAGKTTLLRQKLSEHYAHWITTRCTKDSTYEAILLDAFDQLEATYISESSSGVEQSARGGLSASISVIRAAIDAQIKNTSTDKYARLCPPQLTPQKLAQLLGEIDSCWVLEDFHKVEPNVRTSISQTLKLFCDMADDYESVRLVVVGAVDSARLVVEYDKEMTHRVAEIEVPVLTRKELHSIISNGARMLNIDMSPVAEEIVDFSSGLGSICHRLALVSCREAGVFETCSSMQRILTTHLNSAIVDYVETSSDTLRSIFEDAVERKRVRKFDNGRLILKAVASGSSSGMNHASILAHVQRSEPDYPPSNLTTYLNRMTAGDQAVLRRTGTYYRFAAPIYRAYAQFRFLGDLQADPYVNEDLFQIFRDLEGTWSQ